MIKYIRKAESGILRLRDLAFSQSLFGGGTETEMKIINLIEDTAGEDGYLYEHGLCFYIETASHKLLVDTGASDAFIENARRKGIDLSEIDTVIISHGHYDHTGGLISFAKINKNANIYIHKDAFDRFYNIKDENRLKYIGMDENIANLDRLILLDGDLEIDGELSIFSSVSARRFLPRGNETLRRLLGDRLLYDDFSHEQYLVIKEGSLRVLISGCAHRGILNILDTFRERFGGEADYVISGFHMIKAEYTDEDVNIIRSIAGELAAMNTTFFSGHCTGEYPMHLLREIMGERLITLHSGDNIR